MTRTRRTARLGAVVVLMVSGLLTASCSQGDERSGTTTSTVDRVTGGQTTARPDDAAPTWLPEENGRRRLEGFDESVATVRAIDGSTCELCLLVAQSPSQQQRGLMQVTDPELGGYDGMVFLNQAERRGAFWMRNTKLPLTAVFLDGSGVFIDAIDMTPCADETPDAMCDRYGPDTPFLSAIELAARTPDELLLREGSVVTVTNAPCPERLTGR